MIAEFQCIKSIYQRLQVQRDDTLVRSGDDCAVLRVPAGKALAVSIDTMVEGRHFLPGDIPLDLGYKLLAVNLSDMAAVAATPAWATVSLAIPKIDMIWIEKFLQGFSELQQVFHVELIGGDLTQGPLTMTCEIHGLIEPDKIVKRSGAQVGDLICVTGTLGDAAYAVKNPECDDYFKQRLQRPTPRVKEAIVAQPWLTSAIDISDGLLADLQHICRSSHVGANVYAEKIPLSANYPKEDLSYALTGGDDYELCVTIKPDNFAVCESALAELGCALTWIGEVNTGHEIIVTHHGNILEFEQFGYEHFS